MFVNWKYESFCRPQQFENTQWAVVSDSLEFRVQWWTSHPGLVSTNIWSSSVREESMTTWLTTIIITSQHDFLSSLLMMITENLKKPKPSFNTLKSQLFPGCRKVVSRYYHLSSAQVRIKTLQSHWPQLLSPDTTSPLKYLSVKQWSHW